MTTFTKKDTQAAQKIAGEILNQLGGNKFLSMTGCKNLMFGENEKAETVYIQMDLRKNESKANRLMITLELNDTYTMDFMKINLSAYNTSIKTMKCVKGVYHDKLQEIFTSVTGLNTKL
jgi:hypothetical protein